MPNSPILNVGFYNYVMTQRIIALVSSDSAPMRRLIQTMRKAGNLIDATQGRKTKCVLFTDNNVIILSAISQETLAKRLSNEDFGDDTADQALESTLDLDQESWEETHV